MHSSTRTASRKSSVLARVLHKSTVLVGLHEFLDVPVVLEVVGGQVDDSAHGLDRLECVQQDVCRVVVDVVISQRQFAEAGAVGRDLELSMFF